MPPGALTHAFHHEHPDSDKEQGGQDPGQQGAQKGILVGRDDVYIVFFQKLHEVLVIDARGHIEGLGEHGLLLVALDLFIPLEQGGGNNHGIDLFFRHMRLELAVGNIVDLRGKPVLEEDEDGQGDEQIAERKLEFFFHDQIILWIMA